MIEVPVRQDYWRIACEAELETAWECPRISQTTPSKVEVADRHSLSVADSIAVALSDVHYGYESEPKTQRSVPQGFANQR